MPGDTYCCACDRSLRFGNKTMIAGLCAGARNINLQLRQTDDRPGRRFCSLREIEGLIKKFPQEVIFIRMDFPDLCMNVFHHSVFLVPSV